MMRRLVLLRGSQTPMNVQPHDVLTVEGVIKPQQGSYANPDPLEYATVQATVVFADDMYVHCQYDAGW